MARLTYKELFNSIFLGKGQYFVEGYEWTKEHYDIVPIINSQEVESILSDMKKVFSKALNKRELNKINLFWERTDEDDSFIGIAPLTLFEPHKPSAKKDVMIIVLERYDGKINLIDPVTGEIRQSVKTVDG